MSNYFSDRELGPRARTEPTMGPVAWAGIAVLVEALANAGAFGAARSTSDRLNPPCKAAVVILKSGSPAQS